MNMKNFDFSSCATTGSMLVDIRSSDWKFALEKLKEVKDPFAVILHPFNLGILFYLAFTK